MSETTPKRIQRPNARKGWQAKFLANLRDTANVRLACRVTRVSHATAYRARARDAAFGEQWRDALDEACDILEEEAWRRALHGTAQPVFYKGKECGAVQQYSDQLMMFLLRGYRPARFRENYSVEHSGPGGKPIEVNVTGITDAELELIATGRRTGAAAAAPCASESD